VYNLRLMKANALTVELDLFLGLPASRGSLPSHSLLRYKPVADHLRAARVGDRRHHAGVLGATGEILAEEAIVNIPGKWCPHPISGGWLKDTKPGTRANVRVGAQSWLIGNVGECLYCPEEDRFWRSFCGTKISFGAIAVAARAYPLDVLVRSS